MELRKTSDVEGCVLFGKEAMLPYFREVGVTWSLEKRVALCNDLEIYEVWVEELVGYIAFREHQGHFFLADIQISPKYRNGGLGASLLKRTREVAKSRGYSEIRLQVFKTSPAIKLYLRNGYENVDETDHMFVLCAVL